MRYWLIADGDEGDQWDEFYRDGVVRMTGRQELGNLQEYGSQHELAQELREEYKEEFETTNPAIKARLCFNFGHEVAVGDGIFVRHRRKSILGYGIAEAPSKRTLNWESAAAYFFDKDHPRFPHAIKVRWVKNGNFPVKVFLPMNFIVPIDGDRLNDLRRAMGLASEAQGKNVAVKSSNAGNSLQVAKAESELEELSIIAQEQKAGYQSSPAIRKAIEKYAMKEARKKLKAKGYTGFKDTARYKCYDYTCKKKGWMHYVEVKGTQTTGESIILTRNEVEHVNAHPDLSILVLVHSIVLHKNGEKYRMTGGEVCIREGWKPLSEDLKPIQYTWRVR